MTPCPIPGPPGDTFGDAIDYSVELIHALKACNARLATIRQQEIARCD